ncbi:MAG TPA: HK97-gp10 family putative phage morphogenesis protein, partial [Actinomycetota bacterium]
MAVGGVNVEVKGMAELESALQGLTTKLQKETSVKALRAGGRLIRDAWKSKVPREPRYWPEEQKMIAGAYRRSIGLRTKRTATGAEGMVRTTLWYARYVEQGTSRMSARNYA